MTSYYYLLFIIFAVIAAMMILDENVSTYIILLVKLAKVNYQLFLFRIKFHPFWHSNPISKWMKMKEYERTVEQLAQEFLKEDKDVL